MEYIDRQTLPTVSDVEAASLKKLREEHSVVVAGFFSPDDTTLLEQFTQAANGLKDDYVFATTTNPGAVQAEGVSIPSVILFKKTAEERTVLSPWNSPEALQSLIKTAATPLIVEFLPELYADFLAVPSLSLSNLERTPD